MLPVFVNFSFLHSPTPLVRDTPMDLNIHATINTKAFYNDIPITITNY